jgi:isoaspartyl peptidase/L-asparaginase-like protein (Ntn-hydrolase superfamily)
VVGNEKQVLGAWDGRLGDEGLPGAGASQHHSLNLSCSSGELINLEKKIFF